MKLYWILAMLVPAALAYGQTFSPPAGAPMPMAASGSGVALGAPNVPGAPFSADTVIESTRTLANGEVVHTTTQGKLYRDSQGRTRREMQFQGTPPAGTGHSLVVTDPVQHEMIVFNTKDNTARVLPWQSPMANSLYGGAASANLPPGYSRPNQAAPGQGTMVPAATLQPKPAGAVNSAMPPPAAASSVQTKVDSLGSRELEGMTVNGTRITRTTPAAGASQGKPMVSTTDTWISPELKLTLVTEISDSQGGKTVVKMMNVLRTEPDASLFQVPSNYTVKDTRKQ